MASRRRSFTKEFKLKAVQAYESGTPVVVLTREHDIHANFVNNWTQEYHNKPAGAFRGSEDFSGPDTATTKRIAELEQMIGRLTMKQEFLKKALHHAESILSTKAKDAGTQ